MLHFDPYIYIYMGTFSAKNVMIISNRLIREVVFRLVPCTGLLKNKNYNITQWVKLAKKQSEGVRFC